MSAEKEKEVEMELQEASMEFVDRGLTPTPIGTRSTEVAIKPEESEGETEKAEEKPKPKPANVIKLFRYATWFDLLLILFGMVAAMAHGAALPLLLLFFGDLTDVFINQAVTVFYIDLVNITDVDCSSTFLFNGINTTITDLIRLNSSTGTCLFEDDFIREINNQTYAFVGIGAAVFILAYIQISFVQAAAERQVYKIRLKYYRAVLRQNIAWFDDNPTGEVATRLSDDINKIAAGIGDKFAILVQWLSTFVAGFAIGFAREWRLTLFLLAFTPLLAISGAFFGKLSSAFTSQEQKQYASAGAVAEEVLSAIRTVYAFGGEKQALTRYNDKLKEAKKLGAKKGLTTGALLGAIIFTLFVIYACVFWFGAFLISINVTDSGKVLAVFFSVLIGAFSIGQAGPNLQNLFEAAGAAGAIYETIDRDPPIDSSSSEGRTLSPEEFTPVIQLNNVNFTYPSRPDVQVMHDVSLKVEVGQTVALVGPSGCGKSTVVQLIQRFYDVDGGEVLVGGVNIKELNLKWLRSHIGVVSQEPVLFDTSIAENIRYGKEDATMQEIEEAAKSANAHDFICSLPDGYESLVGEGGELLSGGQKQRIAIARALLRNPSILLLDEATSSLDSQSERLVQNALNSACQGRTTIIIAHRLSTIQNADMIVAIDNGKVAEMGTHDELMSREGIYFNLVQAQTIAEQIPREEVERFRRTMSRGASATTRRKSQRFSFRASARTVRRALTLGQSSRERRSPKKSIVRKPSSSPANKSQGKVSVGEEGIEMTDAPSESDASRTSPKKHPAERSYSEHDTSADSSATAAAAPRATRYAELIVEEEEEAKLPDVSLKQILSLNKDTWYVILFGILAALLAGTVWPAMAIVFGEVLSVFSGPSNEVLTGTHPWGGTFVAIGVVAAVAVLIKNLTFTISGESLTANVRSLLFKSLLRQEVGWFDDIRNNTASLTNRLSFDASEVQGAAGVRLGTLVENVTGLLLALIVAFAYSWIMAIVVLGLMPIVIFGSALHFNLSAGSTKRTNQALKDSTEIAIESIENIRTVATFSLEDRFYREFEKEVIGPYRWSIFYSFIYGFTYGFSQSTILFVYIISFRFGAFLVTFPSGHVLFTEFQDIFRVFAAIIFASIGIGAAASFAPDYNQAKKSAKLVFSIINREPEIDNYSEEGVKPDQVSGEVSANNVIFAYPERITVNVLSNLNLSVNSGKTLAIVGSSGSGKSTIFSLIERFYDPHSGCLMLDGVDLRDINIRWLREKIGFVPQEPDLLEGSIAENIRYGALFREVSDEEVIEAAKSANIHSFIESLPQGYSTNVGAKGTQLSGGQKQRIAIARALIRDPKILLLDEATSALDTESEKVVQEALDKAREGRTSIVIAHRLSTVYGSDCIAVISGGKVAELGTHSELLAKKGIYYKLNKFQVVVAEREEQEAEGEGDAVDLES